eukprot:CAMPEP_0118939202 /NCGR_PEP_ID=MMETSP1169-20130426/28259_1 /TAXON_ID=36882 /ORGANISM="Pyramimonas obovata, Strain CCMP722" /LENGTH=56 /DNA_ID=CAMNT_0006883407 /DNA_START=81 /DNA_END=248 /DNA_ORIENTATION=+
MRQVAALPWIQCWIQLATAHTTDRALRLYPWMRQVAALIVILALTIQTQKTARALR